MVLEILTFCAPVCVAPFAMSHSASVTFAFPACHHLQNFTLLSVQMT